MALVVLDRLLGKHTQAEIIGWAKRLRCFYVMGEYSSGMMDLYEELEMRLAFAGRDDLVHILGALGVLRYGVGDPPQTHTAFTESRISDYPDIVQPAWTEVAGVRCFINVGRYVEVQCSGDKGVSESVVEDALRIEAVIDEHGLAKQVDHSTAVAGNCVSAVGFPTAFV